MKIALMGGTFNPIHNGHLFIAEEVLLSLGYDKVVFVPSFKPAHKNVSSDDKPELRLEMTRLAVQGRLEFAVDACEVERRGTSYTMETIDCLQSKFPVEGKIGLIIGDDLVPGFKTWRMVDRLLATVRVIIARRTTDRRLPFPGDHVYIDNSLLPISSSEIRRRVSQNEAFRYLVPENVYEFIQNRRLYREP
jgi:nicotinate-nucleotide adenylyltransferase